MGQTVFKKKLREEQLLDLQRRVSFPTDEIIYWFHEFSQHSTRGSRDTGYLTEDKFCAVYQKLFPGQCHDFARHVFRSFDANSDGKVDFKEFLVGLSISGSTDVEKQVAWAFRVYDVQGTGYIIKEEMTQIIKSVFRMMGNEQLHYNGVIKTAEALADDIFRQMDKDGDERISWEEFRGGAVANPIVVRLLQCSPPDKDDAGEDVVT